MEWNGNGMKIDKILWNGSGIEKNFRKFNKYNTKFLYFLKNTKNFLLTIHKILNNKTSRVILIENYIIKM
jgi:hypothetical protein